MYSYNIFIIIGQDKIANYYNNNYKLNLYNKIFEINHNIIWLNIKSIYYNRLSSSKNNLYNINNNNYLNKNKNK
jgi:hypothetical protein